MRESEQLGFPLRYRRLGGGYRREDVDSALDHLLVTVRMLKKDLERLATRSGRLEEELSTARGELETYRAQESRLAEMLERAEEALSRAEGLARGAAGEPALE